MLAALALSSSACITMQLPGDFLVLEEGPASFRAVTAKEAKVWVREFSPEEDDATLDFWRAALKENLVENRGYLLVEERDVKDGAGRPGAELLVETQAAGRVHRELIAVFVVDGGLFGDRVRVVEYVAEKELFELHLDAVRAGIAQLK